MNTTCHFAIYTMYICLNVIPGEFCEDDINECEFTICLNGGICEDLLGHALCKCPVGFYGATCANGKIQIYTLIIHKIILPICTIIIIKSKITIVG